MCVLYGFPCDFLYIWLAKAMDCTFQSTHILETAYFLPVFNVLITNSSDKGRSSCFVYFLTGVRAYTVFSLSGQLQTMNHMLFVLFFSMLFPVCVCLSYFKLETALSTHILIKNLSDEGCGSHFASSPHGVRAYTVLPLPQGINQCSPWL